MNPSPKKRTAWNLLPIARQANRRIGTLLDSSPNRQQVLNLFDELMKSQRGEPLAELLEVSWDLAG